MRMDVLTLFPRLFEAFFEESIIGKAREKGIVQFQAVNFRDFSTNKHHTVDDYPYGGGGGMVLKPEPIFHAVEKLVENTSTNPRIILLCPQGEPYQQKKAEQLGASGSLDFYLWSL